MNLYSKYTNLDKKHPIVSRTCLQIVYMLENTTLTDSQKSGINDFCFMNGLVSQEILWNITQKINDDYFHQVDEYVKDSEKPFPYVIDLKNQTEIFLYTTKNFLRDISNMCISPVFPKYTNTEGGSFSNLKTGKSNLTEWVEKKWGVQSREYLVSQQITNYYSELIAKRNAMEHPGGRAGTLYINQPNLKLNENTGNPSITRISWFRNNEKPRDLILDLTDVCLYNIRFVEEIIINMIIKEHLKPGKELFRIPGFKMKDWDNYKYIVV